MEIVNKPDIRVFASEAKTGEVLSFPDVLRGWGITLDQTQGKPPLEWMNDAFNRIDLNNLYLLQQGIPEWNKDVRYPVNSIIKHEGKIYLCAVENENNEPSASSDKWVLYVKNATTTQRGIVQLTNTISESEDKGATPKGVWDFVKEELDKLTPVGTVHIWLTSTAPDGYLFAKGQTFSETQYPKLAQLFPDLKLPDFRGVVPRGLDDGRGFDVGRGLLSYQEDATQKFTAIFQDQYNGFSYAANGIAKVTKPDAGIPYGILRNYQAEIAGAKISITETTLDNSYQIRTANEERMKNIAVNFIIKAG